MPRSPLPVSARAAGEPGVATGETKDSGPLTRRSGSRCGKLGPPAKLATAASCLFVSAVWRRVVDRAIR
jgi:hypothetical protein